MERECFPYEKTKLPLSPSATGCHSLLSAASHQGYFWKYIKYFWEFNLSTKRSKKHMFGKTILKDSIIENRISGNKKPIFLPNALYMVSYCFRILGIWVWGFFIFLIFYRMDTSLMLWRRFFIVFCYFLNSLYIVLNSLIPF